MGETEMKKKLLVFGVLGAVAIPAAALAQGTNTELPDLVTR
jgi:hypothetical protein